MLSPVPPSRQWIALPDRNLTQASCISCHVERSVAIGFISEVPLNGREKNWDGLESLLKVACSTSCWPCCRSRSVNETECRSVRRPALPLPLAWSLPSRRIVVESEKSRPLSGVSTGRTFAGRRLLASLTPLETERYPSTPQSAKKTITTRTVT